MSDIATPWLNVDDGAKYARRGKRSLQRAVKHGQLRAARVGGRRELLFRREWLDEWLEAQMVPVLVVRRLERA